MPSARQALGRWLRRSAAFFDGGFTTAASPYEGGAQGRRTIGWNAPSTTANTAVLSNLTTLRNRSRRAARNDGYAKGALDAIVRNVIGTGIKPMSQADDEAFRRLVTVLFLNWTDESDADGVLDFYGQQSLAVREWMEGGEAFVRRRKRFPSDGLSVPLQLQIIEPELLQHQRNGFAPNGNRIRAGIEYDAIGRRVAYWFDRERPDIDDVMGVEVRRVTADNIVHLYDPLRAGQMRGLPDLTASLVRFYEIDKLDDFTLIHEQIGNLFAGFVHSAISGTEVDHSTLTGQTIQQGKDGKETITLEPGALQQLAPGEEISFTEPPGVGQNYMNFIKHQLRAAFAAARVPYEVVTGDLSGLNDRVMRVILNEFRRGVMAWQHQQVIFQLCRPVWNWWFEAANLSGALPLPPAAFAQNRQRWAAVKWMPQGWPYINPVQDIEASRDAVRDGFSTRKAEVSERGEDSELIDQENASDNDRADKLGLKYDSDGRRPLNAKVVAPVDESSSSSTQPANA